MNKKINKIVKDCDNLQANDTLTVTGFGKNSDLSLYILKDCDYQPQNDKDNWNIVNISVKQNGIFVDDTDDVYVTDGSLHKELERIYNYMDFKTL